MSIPLYGFLEGDTIGLLVLADAAETVLQLAQKLQDAADLRVPHSNNVNLVYDGKIIDHGLTVAEAGLRALDRFDVIRRREA